MGVAWTGILSGPISKDERLKFDSRVKGCTCVQHAHSLFVVKPEPKLILHRRKFNMYRALGADHVGG